MRPPTPLERGAEKRGIPLLAAAVGSALDRLRKSGRSAESIMKDRHFLNESETALVAAAIYDVRVLGDIAGREKSLRQAYLARERAVAERIAQARVGTPWVFAKPDDDPLDEDSIWQMQPEKAIQYFEGLRPGQQLPRDWSTTHRRQAFEMAVTSDQTLLDRVHGLITDRMKSGKGYDFRFDEDLDALGLGSDNPQYAEMVFRTNVMDAYTDGSYNAVADDPEISDEFPYWEYLVVDDDRLSDEHRENLTRGVNGTAYYPASVTFEEARGDRPFNCRCDLRWIHKTEAAELGLPLKEGELAFDPEQPRADDGKWTAGEAGFMRGIEAKDEASHAEEEIGNAITLGTKRHTIEAGGKVHGAVAFERKGQDIFIHHMGSVQKGTGRQLLKHVMNVAERQGLGVRFQSTPDAEGFYKKLGFTLDAEGNAHVPAENLPGWRREHKL